MILHEGIVTVQNPAGNSLPLIPKNNGPEFVSRTHDDPMEGPMQYDDMVHRIKQLAWIPELERLVREVIFQCGRCLQAKSIRNDKAPKQDPIRPYGLAERWHIDIWGPYNETGK